MLHTIQDAVKLTGKSRRSIYDHCTSGRVSYSVGVDGRRYFDTSELIRAYGPLRGSAHPAQPEAAQARTPLDNDLADVIAAAVAKAVAEAIAPLVERLERAEQRLIEHKPASRTAPISAGAKTGPAVSFADLLANYESPSEV